MGMIKSILNSAVMKSMVNFLFLCYLTYEICKELNQIHSLISVGGIGLFFGGIIAGILSILSLYHLVLNLSMPFSVIQTYPETRPKIGLIVAATEQWGIGYRNSIPWYIKEDLQRFKLITDYKPIIMGRKTFMSLPGLLKNRRHIVITKSEVLLQLPKSDDKVIFVGSKEEALREIENESEVWVIGGSDIYKMFMDDVDMIELTIVHGTWNTDTFFKPTNLSDFFIKEKQCKNQCDFVSYVRRVAKKLKRLDTIH